MKRIPLIIAAVITLTGCTSLFHIQDKDNTRVDAYGRPYNQYENNAYYNPASQHVTQQTGANLPGQHVTQKGQYNTTRRPVTGDIVTSLPSRGVKTVTVQGEKLYLYNGIYYKPVRTNSGIVYRVVGSQR